MNSTHTAPTLKRFAIILLYYALSWRNTGCRTESGTAATCFRGRYLKSRGTERDLVIAAAVLIGKKKMRHYSQDRDVLKNLPEGGDGWSTNMTLWKYSSLFQVVMHPKSHLCVEKDCQPNVDALRIESQSKVPHLPRCIIPLIFFFFFFTILLNLRRRHRERDEARCEIQKRKERI